MAEKEESKSGKFTNQYTDPDPRQALFLSYYLDRKSATFSNAYRSALKAGYSEEYSSCILNKDTDWLAESVRDEKLIKLADRNLEELLIQDEDKKVKADLTKFVKSRLQKEKWSERSELSGPNGEGLTLNVIDYNGDNHPTPLPTEGLSTGFSKEPSEIQGSNLA